MNRIESLPGVGPQLASRIRRRFKTDAQFFQAASAMDLQSIASIDGLSERRAVDLVLAAQGSHGSDAFFGTAAAKRIHERIMQRLLRYASTDTGRNRLRLLHPLPNQEAAQTHIAEVMAAKAMADGVDAATVRKHLRTIGQPVTRPPTLDTGLLVVAESDETHDKLHAMGVQQWATLGTPRDLAEADAYDVVVVAYDEGTIDASSIAHAVDVPADAGLAQLCPQSVLQSAHAMAPAIAACQALARTFGRETVAENLQAALDDPNASRASAADIRAAVANVKPNLDAALEAAVENLSLSGPTLLRAMAQGSLPPELQRATDVVLRQGRDTLRQETGVSFQPFTAGLPLGIDEDEVERVIQVQEAGASIARFQAAQKAATQIARWVPDMHDEMRGWIEFDATFALGRFAVEHGLHAPIWGESLAFDGSVHLDLAHTPHAQRIAYRLGGDENVTVLTGANSGGKSTLLEHLCQLVVMARLGLPVVGKDVRVPWLDEVHLVTARRGMDAGAFETFLRGFLPVTRGGTKRLVLADEVESITELDAAGRIIAFVLDRLAASESLAVVVTHLAPQVLEHVKTARIRIDGIEATGLDEQHRLIVDRCPKMGRAARSTPELIVQRLAATTQGPDQALYADLLSVFEGRQA